MTEKISAKDRWKRELEKLEQVRDELRVKAHLLRADAKEELQEIEKKLQKLKREVSMSPVTHAAERAASDLSDASRLLIDTIKESMTRIRNSLKD